MDHITTARLAFAAYLASSIEYIPALEVGEEHTEVFPFRGARYTITAKNVDGVFFLVCGKWTCRLNAALNISKITNG